MKIWQCGWVAVPRVDDGRGGGGERRVRVAVWLCGSGVTSGSGGVAVCGEAGRGHCGHFDRRQVENPSRIDKDRVAAVWQCGCVAVVVA
jgi:hypothetical protein